MVIMANITREKKIYIAGHRGLVGSALVRELEGLGYTNLIVRTHSELDLTNQAQTLEFFLSERPSHVYLAAAHVGGIGANSIYPADFIYQNLAIALNVIDAAYKANVDKLCNLGSSCIYPRMAPQPIREDALLTGALEPTNEPYALAKISAIKLCESYNRQYGTNFLSLMPTNLYGIGDSYDPHNSHVLPALIYKFHQAKQLNHDKVELWGDGTPLREFLYADDLAQCAVHLMEGFSAQEVGPWINVGSGVECSIAELAEAVRSVVFEDALISRPAIVWDTTKPNGTPRKLLDCSRINALGWKASTDMRAGIKRAYQDYLERYCS